MRLRPSMLHCCLALCALAAPVPGAPDGSGKEGLRTECGEVHLRRLAIGKSYSVWRLAESPLVFQNLGKVALEVRVEIVVPSHHDLRPGAKPLPDRRWVSLERTRFRLPPQGERRTDVRLTLPYEPDLAGKTFQVEFWSNSVDAHGRRSRARVHRLLFTVAMDYRDDTEAQFSSRSGR